MANGMVPQDKFYCSHFCYQLQAAADVIQKLYLIGQELPLNGRYAYWHFLVMLPLYICIVSCVYVS